MENWQIDIIKQAFKRCFNLKNMVLSDDKETSTLALQALAHQTGMRLNFLQSNFNQLNEL